MIGPCTVCRESFSPNSLAPWQLPKSELIEYKELPNGMVEEVIKITYHKDYKAVKNGPNCEGCIHR